MIDITLNERPVLRRMQYRLQGSAVLFKYQGGHYAVFTWHQIATLANETLEAFKERMSYLIVFMDDGTDSTNIPFHDFLFAPDPDWDDGSDYVTRNYTILTDAIVLNVLRHQMAGEFRHD